MNIQLPDGDYLCMSYIPVAVPFIMVCYRDKIINIYSDGLCEEKSQPGFYQIVNYITTDQCKRLDPNYDYPDGGILVSESVFKRNYVLWDIHLTHRMILDIVTIKSSPLVTRYGTKSLIKHKDYLHILDHTDDSMKIHHMAEKFIPYHIDDNSIVFIQGTGSKCYDWNMNLLWSLDFPNIIQCGHNNKWFIKDMESEKLCYLDEHGLMHYTNINVDAKHCDVISYNNMVAIYNEKDNAIVMYNI